MKSEIFVLLSILVFIVQIFLFHAEFAAFLHRFLSLSVNGLAKTRGFHCPTNNWGNYNQFTHPFLPPHSFQHVEININYAELL
jgi:hypothetical protein